MNSPEGQFHKVESKPKLESIGALPQESLQLMHENVSHIREDLQGLLEEKHKTEEALNLIEEGLQKVEEKITQVIQENQETGVADLQEVESLQKKLLDLSKKKYFFLKEKQKIEDKFREYFGEKNHEA